MKYYNSILKKDFDVLLFCVDLFIKIVDKFLFYDSIYSIRVIEIRKGNVFSLGIINMINRKNKNIFLKAIFSMFYITNKNQALID